MPSSAPYYYEVSVMRERGATLGCGTATPPALPPCCPTGFVSNCQMALFTTRAIVEARTHFAYLPSPQLYSDVPPCGAYAGAIYQGVQKMGELGAVPAGPNNTFSPEGTVTRGHAAYSLARGLLGLYPPAGGDQAACDLIDARRARWWPGRPSQSR